jgi:hypothetical protein
VGAQRCGTAAGPVTGTGESPLFLDVWEKQMPRYARDANFLANVTPQKCCRSAQSEAQEATAKATYSESVLRARSGDVAVSPLRLGLGGDAALYFLQIIGSQLVVGVQFQGFLQMCQRRSKFAEFGQRRA